MTPDPISLPQSDLPEEIEKAIEVFDNAAQAWGWEADQGTGGAETARLMAEHEVALEALTAAILSRLGEAEAERWQPIETAPKDNEDSILVCDARVVGGFHQVVWWSEGPKAAGYNWYTSDGPNFHRDAFTHWMPLPKEPALTEAGRLAIKDA